MGQARPCCHLFSSFHTNLVASRIRTLIIGVEGADADHQTTTPAATLARVILLSRLIFEAFQGCFFQSFPTKCVVCNSDSSVRLVCGAAVCLDCRKFFDETCDLVKSLFSFDQCSFLFFCKQKSISLNLGCINLVYTRDNLFVVQLSLM